MSGQVQELQVPGTPEGGTLARVLPRNQIQVSGQPDPSSWFLSEHSTE